MKEIEMSGVVIVTKEEVIVTEEEGEADMVMIVGEMTIEVATKDLLETTDVNLEWVVIDEVAFRLIIDELIINSSPCF